MTEKQRLRANEIIQLIARVDGTDKLYLKEPYDVSIPKSLLIEMFNNGFPELLREFKKKLQKEFASL